MLLRRATTMNKLTVKELDTVIDHFHFEISAKGVKIPKSWAKYKKVNQLSKIIGDGSEIVHNNEKVKIYNVGKLKTLAMAACKQLPKVVTNSAYAAAIYEDHYKIWLQRCPFAHDLKLQGS